MSSLLTRNRLTVFKDDWQIHAVDTDNVLDLDDTAAPVPGVSIRGSASDWRDYFLNATLIKTKYESNADTNALTDENLTKLNNISVTGPVDLNFMDGGVI
jgi:hypothetical protein